MDVQHANTRIFKSVVPASGWSSSTVHINSVSTNLNFSLPDLMLFVDNFLKINYITGGQKLQINGT